MRKHDNGKSRSDGVRQRWGNGPINYEEGVFPISKRWMPARRGEKKLTSEKKKRKKGEEKCP